MISCPHIPAVGPIQPFGLLVAIGVLFGAWVTRKYIEHMGGDEDDMRSVAGWCVVVGFIGAHLIDLFFYQPGWTEEPLRLTLGSFEAELPWVLKPLAFWAGISSYGGFLGALVGFFIATRKYKLPRLEYADSILFATLCGWIFGRSACATVHDHLGNETDFFLGVHFDAGNAWGFPPGTYHDLGLYEVLYTIPLALLCLALIKIVKRPGVISAVVLLSYPIPRFFLEYLRKSDSDPRYGELTPAQYLSIATFVAGLGLLTYVLTRGPRSPRFEPVKDDSKSKGGAAASSKPSSSNRSKGKSHGRRNKKKR